MAMRQVPAKLASKLYDAAELIAERGLADAKIDEIADAAGIPKATLYYYFAGKEEILAFLLSDVLGLIAGEVGTAVASPGTASERLRATVSAQLRVMLEHPAVCRALVGDLGRATRLPELAVALRGAFHQPIEQLLHDGVADGSLRQVRDPSVVALSIFGAVTLSALSLMIEPPSGGGDPGTKDATRAAEAICDLLLTGIESRG